MLYGWKENSMLTNCLAACAHLTNKRFWDRAIYLWKKSSFYHTLLHSTPPLGGFPSEYQHPLATEKLEWRRCPMVKKFRRCLFVLTWYIHERDGRTDRQTDRQTLHDSKDRAYASDRTVKNIKKQNVYAVRVTFHPCAVLTSLNP